MKVRVYTDYEPIKILRGVSKKDFIEPTDELAQKCGLYGAFVEVEASEIPKDRQNRNEWKYDSFDKKIKPDQVKVSEKLAKESEKASKKSSILSKLKITEEEFDSLIK